MISVKKGLLRHPAVIGIASAGLVALLGLNALALYRGLDSPWLLGGVMVADMMAISVGMLVTARVVLTAEAGQVRVQMALEESETRLASIVDSAMDAILTVDEAHLVVLFNRAAEQMFQCRRDQAIGAPLDRFLPGRFRAAHRGHIESFGRTGVTSRRMGDTTTLWALRSNGEEFPIEASISQAGEPGNHYFTVILRDVTLRKQAEDLLRRQSLELRALSARLQEAREEEKTRIARELHDELGQLLTALKMDLSSLKHASESERESRISTMDALLDQTVASTRRIAADLRPLMLDDLGLADAAAWLAEDFGKRAGLTCRYEAAGAEMLDGVSKAVGTAVYRALQESLTNIARHAGAKNAWVTLRVAEDTLHAEIEDDGRGIAPEDLAKSRSLGLKGMRERLAQVGGSLEVARAPRGGTRVRLSVPLRGIAVEPAA